MHRFSSKYLVTLADLQFCIAMDGSHLGKEKDDKNLSSWSDQNKTTSENNCDNIRNFNADGEGKSSRIKQLEQQLQMQKLHYQKELNKKAEKIEELEKSILTTKEINKLQNKCKHLYQDGDEIVLQRIGDISDRAARRILEHQQR